MHHQFEDLAVDIMSNHQQVRVRPAGHGVNEQVEHPRNLVPVLAVFLSFPSFPRNYFMPA